jgi:hypothetical protein
MSRAGRLRLDWSIPMTSNVWTISSRLRGWHGKQHWGHRRNSSLWIFGNAASVPCQPETLALSAQTFGRLDPRSGLQLGQRRKGRRADCHYGFPWPADSFQRQPASARFARTSYMRYALPGCGVPLVVQRCRNPKPTRGSLLPSASFFAATVLLRFSGGECPCPPILAAPRSGVFITRSGSPKFPGPRESAARQHHRPLSNNTANQSANLSIRLCAAGTQDDPSKLGFFGALPEGKPPVVLIRPVLRPSKTGPIGEQPAHSGILRPLSNLVFPLSHRAGFLGLRPSVRIAKRSDFRSRADRPAAQEMVLVGHSMGD